MDAPKEVVREFVAVGHLERGDPAAGGLTSRKTSLMPPSLPLVSMPWKIDKQRMRTGREEQLLELADFLGVLAEDSFADVFLDLVGQLGPELLDRDLAAGL